VKIEEKLLWTAYRNSPLQRSFGRYHPRPPYVLPFLEIGGLQLSYPILSQEQVKLRTSNLVGTFIESIGTKAAAHENVGNSSREHSQGVLKVFRAPMYRAHCAVIFAIAQLSCLSYRISVLEKRSFEAFLSSFLYNTSETNFYFRFRLYRI